MMDVDTFHQFLVSKAIGDEAEVVPLLKEAWNAAVSAAEAQAIELEGVSCGIGALRED